MAKEQNYDLIIQEAKNFLTDTTYHKQFHEDIKKAVELIKSNKTITDDDLKEIKKTERQIRQYQKSFKQAMNGKAKEFIKEYTNRAEQIIADSGYFILADYVEKLKIQNQQERVNRINRKQETVKQIIQNTRLKYPDISNLKTNTDCLAHIIKLFPDLNSADKTKEIKNWQIIESVIEQLYNKLDLKLKTFDLSILEDLPLNSEFYNNISLYFKTGDTKIIDELTLTKHDKILIKNKKIEKKLEDPKVAINKIKEILATQLSEEEQLKQITKIIYYRNGQF